MILDARYSMLDKSKKIHNSISAIEYRASSIQYRVSSI